MEYSTKQQIEMFVKEWGTDFHSLLLTSTMLKKSIIDVNKELSNLWKTQNFIDIKMLDRADKQKLNAIISSKKGVRETKVSVYRPKGAKPGKRGDPRFWPYGLNKVAEKGDKLIIFVVNSTSIIIVVDPEKMEDPKAIIQKINAVLY